MVFQEFGLLPWRSVQANVELGLELKGMTRDARRKVSQPLIEMIGLAGFEGHFPHELSGGMKQRVGLARALTAETDILLMDEAFSALDPLIRREMQEQLIELQQQLGKTIVFITHDLNEAMHLGDRIAVMRDGRIVQIGTGEEILNDPANDYVAQFVADVDRTRVLTAASVMEPPQAVVGANAGPRAALHTMRERQFSATFVVGRDRQLRGIVRDSDALAALKQGERNLESIVTSDFESVSETTTLAELFAPALESPLPLAVLDDAGRLKGVIPRVTLLAAMASLSGNNGNGSDDSNGDDARPDENGDDAPAAAGDGHDDDLVAAGEEAR
jgi:glycine betaine/proline transport system ATP-binding protein